MDKRQSRVHKLTQVLYRRERDLRRQLQAELVAREPLDNTRTQPDFMPIRCFREDGATQTYVIFGSLSDGEIVSKLEFFGSVRDTGQNRVFVSDFGQLWYQDGLIGLTENRADTIPLLRDYLADLPRPFTFLGSSAGGYAALLFGAALDAERIIAFAPQTFLTSKVLNKFGLVRNDGKAFDSQDPFADLLPFLQQQPMTGRIEVHYGSSVQFDRRHAERLDVLDNVTLMPHDIETHGVAKQLLKDRKLHAIITGET